MPKRIILVALTILVANCTINKKPDYLGLDNITILNSNSSSVILHADAVFHNPNDLGGTLKAEDIKVFVNGKQVAKITSDEFVVPSKENFTVPFEVSISIDEVINKSSVNLLIGSLLSQEINIQYLGGIDYTVLGYNSKYEVNTTETIKIKL